MNNFLISENFKLSKKARITVLLFILGLAFYCRSAGLMKGLESGYIIHPDSPKQVEAISFYLKGEYLWYKDILNYDGYPYFMNHIDEWIIRPSYSIIKWFKKLLDPAANPPERAYNLFFWARMLRCLYGVLLVLLSYIISRKIFSSIYLSFLVTLLSALAPLSITVSHSVTGDIGLDLFTAITILILLTYASRRYFLSALSVRNKLRFGFCSQISGFIDLFHCHFLFCNCFSFKKRSE
ncbi:MAG: hypothetical protein P9M03_07525 [Candidatus Theseobacter exili]|nr:hypothetical protein [Candidatus Theseobacter exili]